MSSNLLNLLKTTDSAVAKDFWTDLGNTLLGQVIDTGNQLLSGLSLTAAQLLATFALSGGLTGRSVEEYKGFFDDLLDSFTGAISDIYNTVLLPAVNNQLVNVSLLGAHVLAGLYQEGDIIGTLTTLFGKREVKDFWTDLGNTLLGQVIDVGNSLLSTVSLTAAQLLATFALSGGLTGRDLAKDFWTDLGNTLLGQVVDVGNSLLSTFSLTAAQLLAQFALSGGLTGRSVEEYKGFFDDLLDSFTGAISDIYNTVLLPAVNNQLVNVSLLGAHVLAGLYQEGDIIGTLTTLFGKREVKDFWTDLGNTLLGQVIDVGNSLLSTVSLTAAQLLAQFALSGGLSGREIAKGFFDSITDAFTDILNTVLLPAVNTQLVNISLLGAHVLAGLYQEGDIIGTLTTLLGK